MLDAYIIEEIRKQEAEKRLKEEEDRRIPLQIPVYHPFKKEEKNNNDENNDPIIIPLYEENK